MFFDCCLYFYNSLINSNKERENEIFNSVVYWNEHESGGLYFIDFILFITISVELRLLLFKFIDSAHHNNWRQRFVYRFCGQFTIRILVRFPVWGPRLRKFSQTGLSCKFRKSLKAQNILKDELPKIILKLFSKLKRKILGRKVLCTLKPLSNTVTAYSPQQSWEPTKSRRLS